MSEEKTKSNPSKSTGPGKESTQFKKGEGLRVVQALKPKVTNTRKMKALFSKYNLEGIEFDLRVIGMRLRPELQDEFEIPDTFRDDYDCLKPKDRIDLEKDSFQEIKKYQYISAEKSLALDEDCDDIIVNMDVLKERLKNLKEAKKL